MKEMTLSEQCYLALKEQLFEMNNGDFLSIRQCAASFGMSYTPVRQAFIRLQEEGFLWKISDVGYFVSKPDFQDFQQIYQVRKCIEPYALRTVISKLDGQDLAELKEIDQLCCRATMEGDWVKALEMDIRLHGSLVAKLQNRYLEELYLTTRERYKNFIVRNMACLELPDLLKSEHESLISAISQKDADAAVQILNNHIDEGYRHMQKRKST